MGKGDKIAKPSRETSTARPVKQKTKRKVIGNKQAKDSQKTSTARRKKDDDSALNTNVEEQVPKDDYDIYLKTQADQKPSVELLNKFETDARIANLLFNECSGYDYLDSAKIQNDCRLDDFDIREKGINDYLELIENIVPNLNEQTSIRDNFYAQGGHHNLLLQSCGVCGMNDYTNILRGELYNIDSSFMSNDSILRLNLDELKEYKHSRVEGYLNITAMRYYADKYEKSLEETYIYLTVIHIV